MEETQMLSNAKVRNDNLHTIYLRTNKLVNTPSNEVNK
jgi:hypothetical protein